jgi:hypothetical protein
MAKLAPSFRAAQIREMASDLGKGLSGSQNPQVWMQTVLNVFSV